MRQNDRLTRDPRHLPAAEVDKLMATAQGSVRLASVGGTWIALRQLHSIQATPAKVIS